MVQIDSTPQKICTYVLRKTRIHSAIKETASTRWERKPIRGVTDWLPRLQEPDAEDGGVSGAARRHRGKHRRADRRLQGATQLGRRDPRGAVQRWHDRPLAQSLTHVPTPGFWLPPRYLRRRSNERLQFQNQRLWNWSHALYRVCF